MRNRQSIRDGDEFLVQATGRGLFLVLAKPSNDAAIAWFTRSKSHGHLACSGGEGWVQRSPLSLPEGLDLKHLDLNTTYMGICSTELTLCLNKKCTGDSKATEFKQNIVKTS